MGSRNAEVGKKKAHGFPVKKHTSSNNNFWIISKKVIVKAEMKKIHFNVLGHGLAKMYTDVFFNPPVAEGRPRHC